MKRNIIMTALLTALTAMASAQTLTLQECLEIVSKQQDGGKAPAKRRYTKKSK